MTEERPAADRVPMTEDQIRDAWVVETPRLSGPVELVDYDQAWPELFAREEHRIRATLGATVVSLEHVGSTSVPGLAAKPIVDILLVVPDSADESAYVPALVAAGYVLVIREPEWHEHRVFKGPDTNINLHVFSAGSSEVERVLVFRDWLRTHDDDRHLYERTKRELAARDWTYIQNYADAKTEVVEAIIARALAARARLIRGEVQRASFAPPARTRVRAAESARIPQRSGAVPVQLTRSSRPLICTMPVVSKEPAKTSPDLVRWPESFQTSATTSWPTTSCLESNSVLILAVIGSTLSDGTQPPPLTVPATSATMPILRFRGVPLTETSVPDAS